MIKGTLSKVRVPWGKKRDQESAADETVDGIVVSDKPFEAIEQSDSHAIPEPLQIEAKRQKMLNAELRRASWQPLQPSVSRWSRHASSPSQTLLVQLTSTR